MNPQLPGSSSKAKPAAIVLGVLFVLALVFGLWAFSSGQSYKKNSDAKVALAVSAAQKKQADEDKTKYDELAKQPYKTYSGSATYGTVNFNYPQSWSAYVDQSSQSEPLNAYFFPGEVPGTQGDASYPLRVELLSTDYAQAVAQFTPQVTDGSVKSSAYIPPKLKSTVNIQPGVKLDGAIGRNSSGTTQQGSMVIIKVRDKTLQIYTETASGLLDFNNIVLPSLTFVP
ncbi:MAG: hypothetical protein JWO96_351 [Candidatus Saccharibacteria bacterium]|nr:hypothetical protein [Candidatus Saccharibacteria bacterium]